MSTIRNGSRAQSRLSRMRAMILCSTVLSALLVTGCTGGAQGASGPTVTGPSLLPTTSSPAPAPAWLSKLACKAAAGMKDPNPSSVVYVSGRHDRVVKVAMGAGVPDDAPVYHVVMTGDFVAEHSAPAGANATTRGHVVQITFAGNSHEVLDWGIEDRLPDLSSLGTPRSLPPCT